MSLQLDLPADLLAELNDAARREGLEPSAFAVAALRQAMHTNGVGKNGHAPPVDPDGFGVIYVPDDEPDPLAEFATLGDALRSVLGQDYPRLDTPKTRNNALKEGFDD